jgi:cobalt-zinc-cadmium resistance protein CzcA
MKTEDIAAPRLQSENRTLLERGVRFAIRHRWLMLLLTLGLVAVGAWSFSQLAIDATPDITNVQVQINTEAPGYSPLESEQRVTFPVENALAGLPRLEYTRSLSRYGLSQVTVVFEDGTDIYFARQQIVERLAQVKSQLPPDLEPALGPIATGLGEIFLYTVTASPDAVKPNGERWTPTDLRTLNDWVVRPQLRRTPGVTEVNTIGGYTREIHITPDPARLVAYGFTLRDVVDALARNNQNVGAGYIERNGSQYLVRVPNQVADVAALQDIVLARRDGVPIRVRDVASIEEGSELRTGAATENGQEVVRGALRALSSPSQRPVDEPGEPVSARLLERARLLR